MQHIDLEKFANGAFTTQINRAMEEVTKNIQDPNTDATAVRKINVVITMKSNEQRNFTTTGVVTKTTLAPALGAVTAISMGKNVETGEVEAVEIGNQIPGQMTIEEMEEAPQTVLKKVVDPSTGEIYETPIVEQPSGKVVDLRAAREA